MKHFVMESKLTSNLQLITKFHIKADGLKLKKLCVSSTFKSSLTSRISLTSKFKQLDRKPYGQVKYSPDVIIRAFKYFATSRCGYLQLRDDFQLPSRAY